MRVQRVPRQPIVCANCHELIDSLKYDQHANLHINPQYLAPQTFSHGLTKLRLPAMLLDQTTEDSNDAVRSLLPDQMPHPEEERRDIRPPEFVGQTTQSIIRQRVGAANYDHQDLSSNVANPILDRQNLQILDLQTQIPLAFVKTYVPRKQIRKYQNSKPETKVSSDDRVQPKKLNSYLRPGPFAAPSEPVYEIQKEGKAKQLKNKSTVTVPVSRRTLPAATFLSIDTKSNPQNKSGIKKKASDYINEEPQAVKEQKIRGRLQFPDSQPDQYYHPHQCHECHGFYCRSCNSTIPPQYRPYWDEDVRPEIAAYYKNLQELRNARMNCKECHKKEQEKD